MAEAKTKDRSNRDNSSHINANLETKMEKLTSLVEAFDARFIAI